MRSRFEERALVDKEGCFSISFRALFSRLAAAARPTVSDVGTEDNTSARPGKVALWTKVDSATHFDMIAITPLE
jgi:hypothetical protein